ncbi:C1 family peptidase [Sphingomicrobium sediminis]|uniref:C1 family peptidase n=1 Tax=Sphingomicrobium sediminis TaxID=2950949 RepID=A0A9X2EI32_9SPHN|nr:C1 family peptidase [Sphingomicrobium sediminis]MCM8558453.1 C1 family peptidase [Sphingomicrobium sediminis]
MMRYIAALLAFLVCTGPAHAQDVSFGLIPAPAEKYGSIPTAKVPFIGEQLPSQTDLSPHMPPPGDQGQQNSCVGWAVAYALKTYQEKFDQEWEFMNGPGSIDASRVFSPSFVYNQINGGQDNGALFAPAFNILRDQGAAPLSAMPYTPNPFTSIPESASEAALPFKIDGYRTVNFYNPDEVKAQLVKGFPVIIGAKTYQNFIDLPAGEVWRQPVGSFRGNHAMVVVGYNDERNAFKVINSWGRQWGSEGYGWIDYGIFSLVVNEAYIAVDLEGVEAKPVERVDLETPIDIWEAPELTASDATITIAPVCQSMICSTDQSFTHLTYLDGMTGALGMRLTGTVTVPEGVTGSAQIVVPLEFADGTKIQALLPQFALPSGQAAFGTPYLSLDGTGITVSWYAFIPYCAINVPRAINSGCAPPWPVPPGFPLIISNVVAKPTLFIDDFGVAEGPAQAIMLRL